MTDTELREKLVAEDDEYRHLSTKHRNYEQRLTQLTRRNALTPVEDMERINLKKYKLRVKDRMQSIARTWRIA